MKKLLTTALICLSVAGCSGKPHKVGHKTNNTGYTTHVVDTLPVYNHWAKAVTLCPKVGGVCAIYIKKSTYPSCLEHEIRHVYEGDWHPKGMSEEGC